MGVLDRDRSDILHGQHHQHCVDRAETGVVILIGYHPIDGAHDEAEDEVLDEAGHHVGAVSHKKLHLAE